MRERYGQLRRDDRTMDLSGLPRGAASTKRGIKMRDIWVFIVAGALVWLFTSCAPPPASELLKNGVNCKAAITVPDEAPRARETINVDVRIYDCKEPEVLP